MQCYEQVLSALGRPAGPAECFRGGLPVLPLQRSHSARSAICSRRPSRRSLRKEASTVHIVSSASAAAPAGEGNRSLEHKTSKPKVIIAGAGIGGLVLAVGLLNKGFPVQLLERDLTAIRGEGARLQSAMPDRKTNLPCSLPALSVSGESVLFPATSCLGAIEGLIMALAVLQANTAGLSR